MIYPTKFGVAIVSIGFCLYLVSMQTLSGLLFLVLGIIFGCFAVNIIKARASVRNIHILPPPSITCTEGESVREAWRIANRSDREIGHLNVSSRTSNYFSIFGIPGNGIRHLVPDIKFGSRGVYPFSRLQVKSSFPFGLIEHRRQIKCSGEVVVFPLVYPCAPPIAAGFEPMFGGRFTGKYKSQSGNTFHGIRPFQPEDPVKLIHWPSSSKGQGLMAKEFSEELSGRVSMVLGCDAGRIIDDEPTLNWAARACGSLILSGLDQGFHIELATLSDLNVSVISPFSDHDEALGTLAKVGARKRQLTRSNLQSLEEKMSRKSSLCFVLTEVNRALLDFIREKSEVDRRRTVVYLPAYLKVESDLSLDKVPIKYFSKMAMA